MTYLIAVVIFTTLLGAFMYAQVPAGRWRVAGVATYVVLITVVFAGALEGLGRPKPIFLEWRSLVGTKVVSFVLKENVAIYLWIDRGDGEPIAITLPWDIHDAEQIQDAMQEAGGKGGTVELTERIDRLPEAPDRGEIAQVVPPPAMEPKSP